MATPQFIVIAGPNGAGKSTSAPILLPDDVPYINADEIAKQLQSIGGNRDIEAGRLLLKQWDSLEDAQADFAIETTLASKSLAQRIKRLKSKGYEFRLIFLWLPSADLAVARVQDRIKRGGHAIPESTIHRRYLSGLQNLVNLYQPLADTWTILQNQQNSAPLLIARHQKGQTSIYQAELWERIQKDASGH